MDESCIRARCSIHTHSKWAVLITLLVERDAWSIWGFINVPSGCKADTVLCDWAIDSDMFRSIAVETLTAILATTLFSIRQSWASETACGISGDCGCWAWVPTGISRGLFLFCWDWHAKVMKVVEGFVCEYTLSCFMFLSVFSKKSYSYLWLYCVCSFSRTQALTPTNSLFGFESCGISWFCLGDKQIWSTWVRTSTFIFLSFAMSSIPHDRYIPPSLPSSVRCLTLPQIVIYLPANLTQVSNLIDQVSNLTLLRGNSKKDRFILTVNMGVMKSREKMKALLR